MGIAVSLEGLGVVWALLGINSSRPQAQDNFLLVCLVLGSVRQC